jgi:hypothetical protein
LKKFESEEWLKNNDNLDQAAAKMCRADLWSSRYTNRSKTFLGSTMSATILDGNKISAEIKSEVAAEVAELKAAGLRPGLAVVLVGHNPASEIYVRNKVKACELTGIYSEQHTPPETVSTKDLLQLVESLNRRDDIDGILVQLPLPAQVDSKKVLLAVSPEKDVDGFHPMNVGYLSTVRPGLVPCTPAGCMKAPMRWSSAAAILWASRWQCCSPTRMQRSPYAIPRPII